jgi:hypothetical protein
MDRSGWLEMATLQRIFPFLQNYAASSWRNTNGKMPPAR